MSVTTGKVAGVYESNGTAALEWVREASPLGMA
jgi:hypothetical protein